MLQTKVQSFAQACDFKFATLNWFTPVPGLGPLFCPALPRPWDSVGVAVALGVPSCYRFGTVMWQVCQSTPFSR